MPTNCPLIQRIKRRKSRPAQSKIRAAKKNAAMFWRGEAGRGAETNEENEKPQIRFRMLTSVS
jgi:hypothetical protein